MKAKKLKDIKLKEISLVTAPANRQVFHIIKEKKMDEIQKAYATLIGKEAGYTDEEIEVLKSMTEEDAAGITESLTVLAKYKADLPEDMLNAIVKLAEYATGKIPVQKSISDEDTKALEYLKEHKEAIEEFEKAGKKLSKDTSEKISKAVSIANEIVEKVAKIPETLSPLLALETEKNEDVVDEDVEKKSVEDAPVEKTEDPVIDEPKETPIDETVVAKQVELEKMVSDLQKSITEKDSAISELTEKVTKLGKTVGEKQSLDTIEKTEDKVVSKFPSLTSVFQRNQDIIDGM